MTDQDFDSNARKLLMRRILEGSLDKAVNYSPDFRNGQPGPLTIQIALILRRHARLWANEMRTEADPSPYIGKTLWENHMREADAEIKRFLAGHNLTTGHAA